MEDSRKKAKEILDSHIIKLIGLSDESYTSLQEMQQQEEYETTLDAMVEYGSYVGKLNRD